jgi:hypothetical protein
MQFVLISTIAALGGLLFGYDTGVISSALLFIRGVFHLSAGGQSIVAGVGRGPAADRHRLDVDAALFGGICARRTALRSAITSLNQLCITVGIQAAPLPAYARTTR